MSCTKEYSLFFLYAIEKVDDRHLLFDSDNFKLSCLLTFSVQYSPLFHQRGLFRKHFHNARFFCLISWRFWLTKLWFFRFILLFCLLFRFLIIMLARIIVLFLVIVTLKHKLFNLLLFRQYFLLCRCVFKLLYFCF